MDCGQRVQKKAHRGGSYADQGEGWARKVCHVVSVRSVTSGWCNRSK
jgi:hypothetical protein